MNNLIFFVDDEESVSQDIIDSIKNVFFDITFCSISSGKELFEKLKTEIPVMLFLDINMPDLNGFEICSKLKNSPEYSEIFVILITGLTSDSQSKTNGYNSGCDDFIFKPVEYSEIFNKIKNTLKISSNKISLKEKNRSLEETLKEKLNTLSITEKTLLEKDNHLSMIIDNIPAFVSYIDKNWHYSFVNQLFAETYKVSKEDIIGKMYKDIIGERYFQESYKNVELAFSGKALTFETSFDSPDNNKLFFSISCVPDFDELRNVRGLFVLGFDITDHIRIEEELRNHQIELEMQNDELKKKQEEHEALRLKYFDLYNMSPVSYLTINENGKILEVNLTAVKLLLYERHEFIGEPLTKFIFNEDQDINYLFRKKLFNTKNPQVYELRMVKKDGTIFWASLEVNITEDENGEHTCRTTISDITGRIQAEEERKQNEKTMLRYERLSGLAALSSSIAHEIRQPLNSMKILTDMFLISNEENKIISYDIIITNIQKISEYISRIENIIENMSIIIKQPNLLEIQSIDINNVILKVLKMYEQKLFNHNIFLQKKMDYKIENIKFSEIQFQQIIINILNNAVTVLSKQNEKDNKIIFETFQDDIYVIIRIIDNGPGIPSGLKNHIFDPFFTTDSDSKNMVSGFGLGLYVVNIILKYFESTIEVLDNELGGSTFEIKIKK